MTAPVARTAPRAMLALIALAVDLPLPSRVSWDTENGIVALSLDRIGDGIAWAKHLGSADDDIRSHTSDGVRYFGTRGLVTWLGWIVVVTASELVAPDGVLGDGERAALVALVESDVPA